MTGPIYVEDARPGDILGVRHLSMVPRCRYGSNLAANWSYLYKEFGEKERVTIYGIDASGNNAAALHPTTSPANMRSPAPSPVARGTIGRNRSKACAFRYGPIWVRLASRPMFQGASALCRHGGNIDNWRIGAGSAMYYPVQVNGTLFSIGEPHISQGDGELSGTEIEASLDVTFQLVLRQDFTFPSPLLEAPDCWIVHGFDPDLNLAMRNASLDMLELLHDHQGLSKNDAYSLMSVAVDFAVTQVVDGRQGIHVRIPRGIFPFSKR